MSKKATEAVCMISTEKGKMLTVSARTRKYYDLNHMVPKALIGLAVVTIKTDGWVFIFRL